MYIDVMKWILEVKSILYLLQILQTYYIERERYVCSKLV